MLNCYKLLVLLLVLSSAHAQDFDGETEPEVRRYAVEVIIFRYAQDVGTGSELFVPEEATIEEFALMEATPPPVDVPADRLAALRFDSDIAMLKKNEYTMGDILGKLNRLDVYEPVMHFGWAQSTLPEHEREPLMLSRFGTPPEGLDGELTLYLSRFLHLVVDLQLEERRPANVVNDDPMVSYGDYRTLNETGRQPTTILYRIEEDRIFRSGELRYFDHPRFGVLARITRLEEETEGADEEDAELLGYPVE